jgi:DMSO/TMAO reductase YedYZ molybdopterin-dependent catalytic subunit
MAGEPQGPGATEDGQPSLRVEGRVTHPTAWTFAQLQLLEASAQVADVRTLGAKRAGAAVRLEQLLAPLGVDPAVTHIGLHGTRDNFHASIPLEPIRSRALVVYALEGQPLPIASGGPFRFFIPDHAACHLQEIDECANVKFLDRIELTAGKGFDNRPQDDDEHARLHASEHAPPPPPATT